MPRKKKDPDSEKEYIPKEEASKIVNGGEIGNAWSCRKLRHCNQVERLVRR